MYLQPASVACSISLGVPKHATLCKITLDPVSVTNLLHNASASVVPLSGRAFAAHKTASGPNAVHNPGLWLALGQARQGTASPASLPSHKVSRMSLEIHMLCAAAPRSKLAYASAPAAHQQRQCGCLVRRRWPPSQRPVKSTWVQSLEAWTRPSPSWGSRASPSWWSSTRYVAAVVSITG